MKFSTANSQNRHLAHAEARFLPRNLFHFYKKSPHPLRDTPFSPVFPVSLPHPPSCPSNPIRDTPFFAEIPCIAAALDRLTIVSHPRHTLFCRFPCVAASFPLLPIVSPPRHTLFPEIPCIATCQAYFLVSPLPCNSLFFRHFPNPLAPQMRHALPVIA